MCKVSLKTFLVCEDWRGSRRDPGNYKLINLTSEPDKLGETLMKEGKKHLTAGKLHFTDLLT